MSDQAWREKAIIEVIASALVEVHPLGPMPLGWYCAGIGDALGLSEDDVLDLVGLPRPEIVVGLSRLISRRDSGES